MSKVMLSLSSGLPSHFQIGDEALFCASGVNGIGMYEYIPASILPGCPKCRVISVKFTRSKVIYAVELFVEYADGTGEYYESFPLENIDSTFLQPLDQVRAYAAFVEHTKKDYMRDTKGMENGVIDPAIFPPGAQATGMRAIFGDVFKDMPKPDPNFKGPQYGFFGEAFKNMLDEARSKAGR